MIGGVELSIFEILMLVCFGLAWPFSIYRSLTSRAIEGKSPIFLLVVILGYIAGISNKIFVKYDGVVYLYVLNLLMVATDLGLYMRNKRFRKVKASELARD